MLTRSFLVSSAVVVVILGLVGCAPTAHSVSDPAPDDQTSSSAADETAEASTSAVPTLTDAAAAGGPAMAMSSASVSPASLSIAVGDVVTFTSGDGGLHGLVINGLSSVTVAKSLPEYYLFTEAGTYEVSDDLSDATATITVE